MSVDTCPEAMGINCTGLMQNLGIELEWRWPPPHSAENNVFLISLGGYKLKQ